jgi:hypothetical protein
VVSLGLAICRVSVLHMKSCASKRNDASNRGSLDVKWWELDFTHLLSSALKCIPRTWQSKVFIPRSATNKMTVVLIATVKSLDLRADCYRPDLSACILCYLSAGLGNPQCGLPRGHSCCGKPRYLYAELSK